MIGKQLELLKEAVPEVERVGVVVDPDDPTTNERLKPLPEISRALGRQLAHRGARANRFRRRVCDRHERKIARATNEY